MSTAAPVVRRTSDLRRRDALRAIATVGVVLFLSTVSATPVDGTATVGARAVRVDPPDPAVAVDEVFVVGDSLMFEMNSRLVLGADGTFEANLEATGPDVVVDAVKRRTVTDGIDVVRAWAPVVASADLVVVDLGTNDVWGRNAQSVESAAALITSLAAVVHGISPDAQIMWVDVWVESVSRRSLNIDEAIQDLADHVATFHRCPWSDVATVTPGIYASDGVHHTTLGSRVRRDAIIDCITELRSGGPT